MAILTTVGKQWTVDKMRESVAAGVRQQHVGWGTGGATAEAVGQTALTTPAAEARVTGTISSPSAALHRVVATITSASAQTISEVGLFDAATGGVMAIRHVFGGVVLAIGDAITFTIDYTQT